MGLQIFEPSESPFRTIYVDITHRCQMNCSNCYLPNRTIPDMDVNALYSCLRQLPRKTDLRLIGGEPTLRHDLPDIIREIRKLGHRPVVVTNGLKLADEKYVVELKAAGLRYIQLSLNGFQDDSIYQITDQMKCAREKMAAVENCNRFGIAASLSCILMRDINTHLVSELIDFAQTLRKPVRINFRNVGAIGRNTAEQYRTLTQQEMIELVAAKTQMPVSEIMSFKTADNQLRIPILRETRYSRQILVKITDWSIFAAPVLRDPKANVRGRVTQDFRLAPHFEHVKINEFGY